MIRGLYDYSYPEKAEEMLCGKLPLYLDGHFYSNVDWMSVVNNPDLPETVYECMHNPPAISGIISTGAIFRTPTAGSAACCLRVSRA